MDTRFVMRGVAVFVTAIVLLVLLWLFIPSIDQAHSAPNVEPAARPAYDPVQASPPDPRWLSLIREESLRASSVPRATSPSINLDLTAWHVAGRTPLPFTIVVSVTRGEARIGCASFTPFPDGDSYFYLAFPTYSYPCVEGGSGGYYSWRAGDVVWVTQAGNTVSMTVPTLTALAAPETDRVYGVAPVSQSVMAYLFPFATSDVVYTQTVTANASGNYTATWSPAYDLRPRDNGYVAYAQDANRRAYVRFVAPFLRAWLSGQEILGFAAPNASVLITLTDAQETPWLTAYANTDVDGSFWLGWYYGWTFNLKSLRSGDRVVASVSGQTFSMTVTTVTAQGDLASGQVWGEAPPNQPVDVLCFAGPLQSDYDYMWSTLPAGQTSVTATAQGHYTASLPLSPADYGAVVVTSPDDNQTYVRFALPYLGVRMGEGNLELPSASIVMGGPPLPPPPGYFELWGQVADLAAPITIAIQGPSGYLKDLRFAQAAGNGYFYHYVYDQRLVLDTGDVITVTTSRGVQAALSLPRLTAHADPVSDTISGLAPPGARLAVSVITYTSLPPLPPLTVLNERMGGGGGYGRYTVIVTATAQGEYRADFSGVTDITESANVELSLTTSEGYTVVRTFRSTGNCQLTLGYVQVGGNQVTGLLGYCSNVVVRLRDAQGQVKAESAFASITHFVDKSGHPIAIQPGDMIEVQFDSQLLESTLAPALQPNVVHGLLGSQFITVTVPTLTVALDTAENAVAGQAPPGAVLTLDVYRESSFQRQVTTTVSAQGMYSVSLTGLYSFEAGDHVRVIDNSANLPYFYADGVLPLVQATLYDNTISGWLPPLTPYTASLETSRPVTAQTSSYADTTGRFSAYLVAVQPTDTVMISTPHQVMRLVVPFLSAQVDRATATVYGQAPPLARLQIDLANQYGGPLDHSQMVTATASGVYTASFPDMAPMSNGSGILTYFSADGYQVRLNFATTSWQIVLDDRCVSGNAGVSGQAITVMLAAGDGTWKDSRTTNAYGSGRFTVCFSQTVQVNDRLTLTRSLGVITWIVPRLTAEHDFGRQVLEGQATPNVSVAVSFQTAYYSWELGTRHTIADASGHYGIDTSDLGLKPGYTGSTVMTDEAGNTIQRSFTIRGYQTFMPLVAWNR